MNDNSEYNEFFKSIPGGSNIINALGFTPDFHDSEIEEIIFKKGSIGSIEISIWTLKQSENYPSNVFEKSQKFNIILHIRGIFLQKIEDFNESNIINFIYISRFKDDDYENDTGNIYNIEIDPIYGLSGRIKCRQLELELRT